MERITLRIPSGLLHTYDCAEGNRSALIRRAMKQYVEDGELRLDNDDLRRLAMAESASDETQLDRRRATFRARCAEFFGKLWERGGVSTADVDALADSWRTEAGIHGDEYEQYVEQVVEWWRANTERGRTAVEFPGADHLHRLTDSEHDTVREHVRAKALERLRSGATEETVVDELAGQYARTMVEVQVESAARELRGESGGGTA